MATAFFLVYELFIFMSFTIFISLPCLTIDTTITNPKHAKFGFAVDLIHRDSPLSPLYNPETTFWDKAEKLYETSIARYAYLTSKRSSDQYRTDVIPSGFTYLAKLNIGAPPVDVFALVDTGSEVLWIQCDPCEHCQPQTVPIYDRTKSTTYKNLTYSSGCCDSHNNVCSYQLKYVDGSYSNGFLATEFISFANSNNGIKTTLRNVAFGCGVNNNLSAKGQVGGVLGLVADELSLVSQLRSITKPKFSYCLGNASDPSSKGNLIIGEDAHISGFTTPFTFYSLYQVYVEDIKVGSQSLNLPPGALGPPGNVILDSGAVYTFLPPKVHDKLADVISQELKRFNVRPIPPKILGWICYRGRIGRDLNGFPTMTISFKGHAKLVLERWSIFIQEGNSTFCLAFAHTSGPNKPCVIGSNAQQFYNFGFDLVAKELSIIRSVCIY
ncbi:aspartic proteinase CDR1-like [Telopea speciosissima]|uniref:aspartic proteinase CDR1-like n=1 Tax=Telopea speciosissima TaxID=54955 RepID=UPI001CC82E66|nr:aspartic proteinase CDR1-like [Telopea speciosissima]